MRELLSSVVSTARVYQPAARHPARHPARRPEHNVTQLKACHPMKPPGIRRYGGTTVDFFFTEYFERKVLLKLPYLTREMCIRVVRQPLYRARATHRSRRI